RGPIRKEYLDAHTPPLPLWRQQLEDGLGRFFVGILPGVNLLVDYIVPARSLPGWARQGIDFASAVVGAVVPVPEIPIKLPKLGDVGELNPFKKFKPAEEIKAADEINPVEANAHGEPVNAPKPELSTSVPESAAPTSGSTSGIPLVPEEYSRSPSGKLTPDPDYRGLYRDEGGQHYIQQDGKTYPVDWNDTAHRWQMQPREGSPNAPKMHINEKGNWEVDLDTGLKGGVRPRPVESYKQAFDLYERGKLMSEIADELLVDPVTAKKWVETYVQESGDLRPQRVGGAVDKGYRLHAPKIYSELQEGKSLKEVSNKYTDGNELAGYRNATWFAEILGFPTDVIPQDRPWRIRPERDPNQIRYPISQRQYARIQEGLSQGQSTEKMGKDTGVLTSWVEKIQAGNGRYWPETQEWIQTGDVHEPAEPPAQQLHTGVEPSGSREPQPATSRPVQQQPVASAGPRKRSGHVDRFDDFREAFERYERGENFVEIGDALGVTRSSARQWVERFMSESGAVIPQRIGGRIERTYMARRAQIYHALSEGKPLAEVANDFTDGEELAALRAGRRYAAEEHLPTDRFPQERPWRIQAEGTSDRLGYRPNDQQRADIFDGFDQRKPTWQISMETGVPEDLIEQMRAEHGGIEHGNVPDPAEPPAKRQRTDGASGDTPQPQPQTGGTAQAEHLAPSGPEPSWGSPQLRQYYEDHTQLSQAESDSIDAWFNGNGPAPPSLQAELIARGYSDITPEMIRMYFTDKNPVLTVRQMQRITEFLCI
ncbi:hypothetical protein, partial [Caballeronia sp. LZ034LL]|uniref:hypothetical protein n=1 Tax=Caballeronia sp. LZ034LL TaxID=3038567 RepID=UPI002856C366